MPGDAAGRNADGAPQLQRDQGMTRDTANWVGLQLFGGRYDVRAKLGEGGMAHVYRVRDTFLERDSGALYDLVFLDPPYDSAPELGVRLSELLPGVLAEDAVIVTESDKRKPLDLAMPQADERTYGDTRIAIHRG